MGPLRNGVASLLVVALAGCAGSQVPARQFGVAQGAIETAREAGAADSPKGALHLALARDQLAQAQRFNQEDRAEEAAFALSRAKADAELAAAYAREASAWKAAQDVLAQVRAAQRGGR